MPVMFNEDDLSQQQRVKCAFDPTQILTVVRFSHAPPPRRARRMHIHHGQLLHPDLPRF